jgi:hypothetical protein
MPEAAHRLGGYLAIALFSVMAQFRIECPTDSGHYLTINDVAVELKRMQRANIAPLTSRL